MDTAGKPPVFELKYEIMLNSNSYYPVRVISAISEKMEKVKCYIVCIKLFSDHNYANEITFEYNQKQYPIFANICCLLANIGLVCRRRL